MSGELDRMLKFNQSRKTFIQLETGGTHDFFFQHSVGCLVISIHTVIIMTLLYSVPCLNCRIFCIVVTSYERHLSCIPLSLHRKRIPGSPGNFRIAVHCFRCAVPDQRALQSKVFFKFWWSSASERNDVTTQHGKTLGARKRK